MIMYCKECEMYLDDEFRTTVCPHETFMANDGSNTFQHHPESYLSRTPPQCTDAEMKRGLEIVDSFIKNNGVVPRIADLKSFLYILLRDHLPAGVVEEIMLGHVRPTSTKEVKYSNLHLASYAEDLAKELMHDN